MSDTVPPALRVNRPRVVVQPRLTFGSYVIYELYKAVFITL